MQRTINSVVVIAVALGASCQRAAVITPEVVAVRSATVPDDPNDPVWQSAPEHVAPLLLQDLVEPRLMTVSTPEVRVRALTNGSEIAFRLEWADTEAKFLPYPATWLNRDGWLDEAPESMATGIIARARARAANGDG